MNAMTPAERWGLALVTLLFFVLSLVVTPGAYSIDETIYLAAADAFHRTGGFIVHNGYDQFESAHLLLWFLRDGPNGLAPQYPIGSAVLGGLLEGPFGRHALLVANAFAGAATLFAVSAFARTLFADARVGRRALFILIFATFWMEFVFGIWPHSISTLFVTVALLCGWKALCCESEQRWALFAGFAIGAGLLFRTDAVLALPVMVLSFLLVGQRPGRLLLLLALGLLPGLMVSSLANHFKFGTFNPLSYGASGASGVSLGGHFAAALLGLACVVLLSMARIWHVRLRSPAILAGIIALGVFVVLVPDARSFVVKYLDGAYALTVDATTIEDGRLNVVSRADGIQLFWGLPKKALGQSLPWLGLLCFLLVAGWRLREKAGIAYVVGACLFWTMPFFMRSWHGGLGSNMRYFLPILPLLAVLASFVWARLTKLAGARSSAERWGPWCIATLLFAWIWLHTGEQYPLHQIYSTYLFGMVCAVSLLAAVRCRFQPAVARLALTGAASGFVLAAGLAAADVHDAFELRTANERDSQAIGALASPSLVVGMPEALVMQLLSPHDLVANTRQGETMIDGELLRDALTRGYHVYVDSAYIRRIDDPENRLEGRGRILHGERHHMIEISLRGNKAE